MIHEGLGVIPLLWTMSVASNITLDHFFPLTVHSPVARGRIPSTVGQHLQTLGTLQQTRTHIVTLLRQIITYCRWYTRDILPCTHARLTPMCAIIFLQTVEGAPNDQTVSSFLPE